MSRREKIIVAIMAATVLLGGYLYVLPLTPGRPQGVGKQPDVMAIDFAQKVTQQLKADTGLAKDLFTIRNAERKWDRDPFLKTDRLLSDTQQREADDSASATGTQPNLIYTGFLEVGTQRLAIINGIEYASGEAIDSQGHYLRRIHPNQVEIGKQNAPGVLILELMEHEAITRK
jgi:hypothetical protein